MGGGPGGNLPSMERRAPSPVKSVRDLKSRVERWESWREPGL